MSTLLVFDLRDEGHAGACYYFAQKENLTMYEHETTGIYKPNRSYRTFLIRVNQGNQYYQR